MIVLARLLARLVGIVLIALIAVTGLAAAVFCIGGGHSTLSLAGLASDLHLAALRSDVNSFLARTTAPGSVAIIALLGGAAAMAIGLVLIIGCWVSPRPWRIVLGTAPEGSLGVRRRALARLAVVMAERDPQVDRARARAQARRRRDGGRLRVRVRATASGDRHAARDGGREAAMDLVQSTPVTLKVRARRATRRRRREALQAQA